MSMFRQFWLAIIAYLLLAGGGSLLASLLSARSYFEAQLSIRNADHAAALALSLSQSHADWTMIELITATWFDSGHYELIRVIDSRGRRLVEHIGAPSDLEAPGWPARWLPIHAHAGTAVISNGPQQIGTLTLLSDRRLAYDALGNSAWQTATALALATLVGGWLGSIVLGRLKAPLQAVIDQATAISERRFVTIDEPTVPELKRLVRAMNGSVSRLRTIFAEEAARLEVLRREATCDSLTGLANRSHFMACLWQTLTAEDAGQGALLLIRLHPLADINQRLGRDATDDLLRQAAHLIDTCASAHSLGTQGLAGRLSGADFALILPASRDGPSVAATLLSELVDAGQVYTPGDAVASIAVGSYRGPTRPEELLARTDAALRAAEAAGANTIRQALLDDDPAIPRRTGEWSQMIRRALDRQWVDLRFFAVIDASGGLLHREGALRLRSAADGECLPAGRFLPFAERLRLTPALDLVAVVRGLHELKSRPELCGVAINLSASSVADAGFRKRLLDLLGGQAEDAPRLWFEVAEHGALRHLAALRELRIGLKATGCRLGLEHFGHQFSEIGRLHDLGLDYLKVDSSFIHELPGNRGNAAFLKGLVTMAHGIGLQVLAEGVSRNDQWQELIALGLDGATGPAIADASPPSVEPR